MNALVTRDAAKTVGAYLTQNIEKLRGALTNTGLTPERMIRVAVNAVAKDPNLQKCSQISLIGSILQSAALGLEINTPLQEAYLIPYGTSATFQPGYRGLIKLARRGDVKVIFAEVIKEKDEVEVLRGMENTIKHKITLGERGKTIGYYAVFKLSDGTGDYEIMSMDQIDAVRRRSAAASRGKSPWDTDWDEMAKKTVLKRLLKRAPLQVEAAEAMDRDNKADQALTTDAFEVMADLGMEAPELEDRAPALAEPAGHKEDMVKRGIIIVKSLEEPKVEAFVKYLGWIKKDEGLDSLDPSHLRDIATDEKGFRNQVAKYAELEPAG
jgi:recombination protein RecT